MKVKFNTEGYVTSFALVGDLTDSKEIEDPKDLAHFFDEFRAYKLSNNVLVFDEEKKRNLVLETAKQEYRTRREKECFPIINRGQLWYEELTNEQKKELKDWYHAWLDNTPTQTAPERPVWLK